MNPVSIVVLAKYAEIFEKVFRPSAERWAPGIPKILVRDGQEIPDPPGWIVIQGPERFSMAGNANLGWRAVPPAHDIFYSGDDVELLEQNSVERLRALAYSDPKIGILSPRIIGADQWQACPPMERDISFPNRRLAFVCVYIKRAVVDLVGYLDERFKGYGSDDDDYCKRVKDADFHLAVTPRVTVRHDHPTATFRRNYGGDYAPIARQMAQSRELFEEKYR